jgi:CheY-like chemotaxis protein
MCDLCHLLVVTDHRKIALTCMARFLLQLPCLDLALRLVMRNELVLVVEDDESIAVLVGEVVRHSLGLRSLVATDGEQALRLIWSERPDLVLLDLALPGLDGLEIARLLKLHPATRDTRIIVFTALGVSRHRAMEVGCDDFLEKPFDIEQLLSKVGKQLAARVVQQV